MAELRDAGHHLAGGLAINLSARQFTEGRLADQGREPMHGALCDQPGDYRAGKLTGKGCCAGCGRNHANAGRTPGPGVVENCRWMTGYRLFTLNYLKTFPIDYVGRSTAAYSGYARRPTATRVWQSHLWPRGTQPAANGLIAEGVKPWSNWPVVGLGATKVQRVSC